MLLAIAESGAHTGYEFIGELERVFGPAYRPSPGGVYPAISALTAERLLQAKKSGRSKQYSLTPAGKKALDSRRSQLASLEARTGARLDNGTSLGPALERFVGRVARLSGRVDPARVDQILDRTAATIEKLGGINDGDTDDH